MKCPDCQVALKPVDCKGVIIHECVHCSGKWFQRDELKRVQATEDPALRWLDFELFTKEGVPSGEPSQAGLCPECLKKMYAIKYAGSEVIVDKCSCCQGIWLHRGELVKIIRYLKGLVDAKPAGALAKESFSAFLKILASDERLVSEVKDFFAVLYLLELRIAAVHPELADAVRRVYQATPFK